MGFPPTTPLPETVRVGHRFRPFQDGGGRCSPGRYRPERRPTPPLSAILPLLTPIVTKHSLVDNFESLRRDSFGRQPIPTPTNPRPETYKPKSLITSDIKKETLWTVHQHIHSSGYFQTNCGWYTSTGTTQDFSIPPHQPFPLTALGQVLLHAKDKDHLYPAYLRDNRGPVGVDEDLPQAPYVFPNDETKAEHADIQPLRDDLDNYPSAIDAMREVRKDYSEERQLEMTAGPFHAKQALQTYLKSEDFIIIPLGRKDEGLSTDGKPKGRNIQDGNRVGLSGHIHSHTHTHGVNSGAYKTNDTGCRYATKTRHRLLQLNTMSPRHIDERPYPTKTASTWSYN